MRYSIASIDGLLRSSSHHLEDAVNSFARRHLGFSRSACWTTASQARNPADFPGAAQVRLIIEKSNDAVPVFETLWVFDPRKRFERLKDEIKGQAPDSLIFRSKLQEIAVLVPMIGEMSLADAVVQINDLLPENMKCRISDADVQS